MPSSKMDHMISHLQGAFETDRLVFLPIEDEAQVKAFIYREFFLDPVNAGLAGLPGHATLQLCPQERARDMINGYVNGAHMATIICLKSRQESEDPQASADSIYSDDPPKPKLIGQLLLNDKGYSRVSISISIASEHQNKGYGREAINWALEWAFRWGAMNRVDINAASYNERAVMLYQSIGFVEEGIIRKALFMNGEFHNIHEFGILAGEWWALQRAQADSE
ncbi:Uu.00g139830.m01.CDS01 [Anthostomella pinea]|uniref:Uu.00g139830.m01.CDS01 n=1 Tax=Anthostomella pinea TaxID=933095 RepID=A0AAI8YLA7_9PEZI|nr:Uu.00g139830.m01.CDS01 [Anthostomella pinea]